MDIEDIAILIIALYGAILSSLLGVQQLKANQRKLFIFFEIAGVVHKSGHLKITNTDYQPITITEIHISPKASYQEEVGGPDTSLTISSDVQISAGDKLPVKLNEGESVSFALPKDLLEIIDRETQEVNLIVRDLKGNIYKKYYSMRVW